MSNKPEFKPGDIVLNILEMLEMPSAPPYIVLSFSTDYYDDTQYIEILDAKGRVKTGRPGMYVKIVS